MSKSLSITLVDTRAPPSRQICAKAPRTLLPRTPDLLHAARWWPRASRRRPHRQERTDRGKGKRRRWSNKTRNCSASIRLTRFVGMAVKGTDDNGPLCDLTIALSAGVSCGHTTCSRWWDCTETDACFCHPRASEGSLSSSKLVAGRTPPANASYVGNCTPSSWRCAAQSWTADRKSDTRPCIPLMMSSATCGYLARAISRQSAQLPQWAASRSLRAPPAPTHPSVNGNDKEAIAPRSTSLTHRHLHSFLSCSAELCSELWTHCPQPIIGTCGHVETQEKPPCLDILHSGYPLEQSQLFCCLRPHLRLYELLVANWDTKDFHSLFRLWESLITPPVDLRLAATVNMPAMARLHPAAFHNFVFPCWMLMPVFTLSCSSKNK